MRLPDAVAPLMGPKFTPTSPPASVVRTPSTKASFDTSMLPDAVTSVTGRAALFSLKPISPPMRRSDPAAAIERLPVASEPVMDPML